ncbi:MAG: amidohydrolase family protein [Proteobacteria bacterium]|nr:amidohydrolase family protein [Burkholderiales bacterium]
MLRYVARTPRATPQRAQSRRCTLAIDFHAYFQPHAFLDRLRHRSGYPRIERVGGRETMMSAPGVGRPLRPEQNDLSARLALMDAAGIDTQILRLQNVSGIDALELDEGRDVARAANEESAALARQYPGRFIAFASVPMKDIGVAIAELEYAVSTLGHRGVGISVITDGVPVDDVRVAPLLDRVEALGIPLLLLPNHPSTCDPALAPFGWLTGAFGFQVDISIVALRLLCSGALERRPRLRVILANLGGVLPFVSERLDQYWQRVHAGGNVPSESPREGMRRFHFETASGDAGAIRLAADVVGVERLVFGSDYPSFDMARAVENVRQCGLPESDVARILTGNARVMLAA